MEMLWKLMIVFVLVVLVGIIIGLSILEWDNRALLEQNKKLVKENQELKDKLSEKESLQAPTMGRMDPILQAIVDEDTVRTIGFYIKRAYEKGFKITCLEDLLKFEYGMLDSDRERIQQLINRWNLKKEMKNDK